MRRNCCSGYIFLSAAFWELPYQQEGISNVLVGCATMQRHLCAQKQSHLCPDVVLWPITQPSSHVHGEAQGQVCSMATSCSLYHKMCSLSHYVLVGSVNPGIATNVGSQHCLNLVDRSQAVVRIELTSVCTMSAIVLTNSMMSSWSTSVVSVKLRMSQKPNMAITLLPGTMGFRSPPLLNQLITKAGQPQATAFAANSSQCELPECEM